MTVFKLKYSPYGSSGVLVEWPLEINDSILKDRIRYEHVLRNKSIELNIEIIAAYNSLLIIYDTSIDNFYNTKNQLLELYYQQESIGSLTNFRWIIPVCYEGDFAIDFEEYSLAKKLSKNDIVDLHCNQIYKVHFIGFLPGFLYLGGLDEKLHFPRKSTPSLNIKKGSVAIGGLQTGVYPINSPGGWHVIGNSPINWFDVDAVNPCFASSGDEIIFDPISRSTYNEIATKVSLNEYQLEKSILND